MNSKQNMRRRALCMAMGACLASMAAAPVFAQSVTGAVAGRAEAGAQVTISNPATGLTRSATVGDDGSYRIGQMPPRSDEHTSELQSRMRRSYAVFCLKKHIKRLQE